jgi:hypothetical protein
MPRPKSGKPPLVAIAVKLAPDELENVRRYTHRHYMSISDLVREGLALRMQQPPQGQHEDTGTASYTSNTATQSEAGTTTALEELREMVQAQARRLDTLIAMLEHREHGPGAAAQSSHTVIPLHAHAGREPVPPAGMTDKRPNYGKLTAAVLEAIQGRTRFTSAEIALELGRKPTTVWQALQGLVKKGVLQQRGRYGEAVYIKVEREGT